MSTPIQRFETLQTPQCLHAFLSDELTSESQRCQVCFANCVANPLHTALYSHHYAFCACTIHSRRWTLDVLLEFRYWNQTWYQDCWQDKEAAWVWVEKVDKVCGGCDVLTCPARSSCTLSCCMRSKSWQPDCMLHDIDSAAREHSFISGRHDSIQFMLSQCCSRSVVHFSCLRFKSMLLIT